MKNVSIVLCSRRLLHDYISMPNHECYPACSMKNILDTNTTDRKRAIALPFVKFLSC